jgi:hypothetical protein
MVMETYAGKQAQLLEQAEMEEHCELLEHMVRCTSDIDSHMSNAQGTATTNFRKAELLAAREQMHSKRDLSCRNS